MFHGYLGPIGMLSIFFLDDGMSAFRVRIIALSG